MKKLYFIITLLFTVLLASCSQEEPVNGETDNSRVSISAELPGDIAATRAQITIPTTHKLRCIIEVWTKSDSPFLKYCEEIAVAAGTVPTFDFPLRPGDYTCLMWADFIAADAAVSEVTSVDGVTYTHFEDTYYDTSNLHQLTVKDEFASNLFDTDLCDGFYAKLEVKKNAAAVNESMKLTRPFAKLIVQETDAEKFATLTGLTVSFEMPKTFSVATGEPGAEMLTAVYDKNFASAEDAPQILYTGYVFTPSTGLSLGSSILTFTTAAGKSTREIPGESIELKRNQQMTAGGKLMGDGALDPGTDPDPEPSKDPQVGDYFFIDGTWSSELTEENKANCVGIVYAVGAQGGDDISNYPNSEGKSIKGYVMALQNVKVDNSFDTANKNYFNGKIRPYFYQQNGSNVNSEIQKASKEAFKALASGADWNLYNGFSVTKKILATEIYTQNKDKMYHPALTVFEKWKETTATVVANSSGWYIPSSAQLLQFTGGLFGFAGESAPVVPAVTKVDAYNSAFMNAIDKGITKHFPTNNKNAGYYMYSLSLSNDPAPYVLQIGYGVDGAGSIKATKPSFKVQADIRPVLTIIK